MSLNKHYKLKERINLTNYILYNSIPMPSYSNYKQHARRIYIVSLDS